MQEIRGLELPVTRVKQINLCGCGLAALEMVLRYYGADIGQLDFLRSDGRLQRRVEREDPRGLSEATIGVLALKRGFKVILYGDRLRVGKTFLKLGGRVVSKRTDKGTLLELLNRGIPPIVKMPDAGEAYGRGVERIPHYIVVKGVRRNGSLHVADPWYDRTMSGEYWKRWSSSIIAVEGSALYDGDDA